MFRYAVRVDRPRWSRQAAVLLVAIGIGTVVVAAPGLAEPTSPTRVTFEVLPSQPSGTPTPTQPPGPTPTPTQPGETPAPTQPPHPTPTQPPYPSPTQPGDGELPVSGASWSPGLFLLTGLLLLAVGAVLVYRFAPTAEQRRRRTED